MLLGLFALVLYSAGLTLIYKERLIEKVSKNPEATPHTNADLMGMIGLLFGFLTGLLGVGGGFLIVPLLIIVFRYKMKIAIGTSVAIIAMNSFYSLIFRISNLESSFIEVAPLALLSLLGVLVGLFLHSRINEKNMEKAFSILLLFLAFYTTIDFAQSL